MCAYGVERTFLAAAGERFCSCRCARVVKQNFKLDRPLTTHARTQVRLHANSLKSAHACRSSAENKEKLHWSALGACVATHPHILEASIKSPHDAVGRACDWESDDHGSNPASANFFCKVFWFLNHYHGHLKLWEICYFKTIWKVFKLVVVKIQSYIL